MKTTAKKFSAVFGNSYELEILSKDRVFEIIDHEIDQEEVLRNVIEKHVNGTRTEALLNVSTGEIEYHTFIGNTDLQQRGHLIELYTLDGNEEEGLDIEDFLNEKEIEEAGDYPWEVVRKLEDYQDRLFEAFKFYWTGFNDKNIVEQVEEIYELN